MNAENIFVGRLNEIEQWKGLLADPQGQTILVVGQQGMGKTLLVNRMAEIAHAHPDLKCGYVRYEVTSTDPPETTLRLMIDHAIEAAQVVEGSFDLTEQRYRQWRALFDVFPKGKELRELFSSLQYNQQLPVRDQFIKRLKLISQHMPENGRTIFVIDPEKYMPDRCADTWRLIANNLPSKIKFLFAQRNDDQLISDSNFCCLSNVKRIPKDGLDVLDNNAYENLLDIYLPRLKNVDYANLRRALDVYKNHPYAVRAALEMLVNDQSTIEQLPRDPTSEGIAEAQWKRVCQHGLDAINYFRSFAILLYAVPDEISDYVAEINSAAREHLLSNAFLNGLLRSEPEGRRIYHSLLADHILRNLSESDAKYLNKRAMDIYRIRLNREEKPDELAALRLPEHALAAEGNEAFVSSVIDCNYSLVQIGLLETSQIKIENVLKMVKKDSLNQAASFTNLGLIYRLRGDLDQAKDLHLKALKIKEKINCIQDMAADYGNLGLIYNTRGDLEKAKEMHQKSLKIYEEFGCPDGMAKQYGNLGLVYSTSGDFDMAETLHKKAYEINVNLGLLRGIAIQSGNLGLIYKKRGELDKAKKWYCKSLKFHKIIGNKEGLAKQYGNLGNIYRLQGYLDKAEKTHKKSLKICKTVGLLEGVAKGYGNIGAIYLTRGDLDTSEKMLHKALKVNKKIKCPEGIAIQYSNLGTIYNERQEFDKARNKWEQAKELYKKIGMPHMIEQIDVSLNELPPETGGKWK